MAADDEGDVAMTVVWESELDPGEEKGYQWKNW